MSDNQIKEAFRKVKEDMFSLGKEISSMKLNLLDLKKELHAISTQLKALKLGNLIEKTTPTHLGNVQTDRQIIPTHNSIPTDNLPPEAPKSQILDISTGNRGVPTDRQTDKQTNRHIENRQFSNKSDTYDNQLEILEKSEENKLDKADEILEDLHGLREEVKKKFTKLTPQELSIFSLIYILDDQKKQVDYALLSQKTKLSESSVRDYIYKIAKKGIPIQKEKINNKRIILHISQNIRKIAPLEAIMDLKNTLDSH